MAQQSVSAHLTITCTWLAFCEETSHLTPNPDHDETMTFTTTLRNFASTTQVQVHM